MKILIGFTGFVGSNLDESTLFDFKFNSKNIVEAFGLNPDVCVYAGIKAEKYLANADEISDFKIILNAIENIKKINPKRLILISTIDVYDEMGAYDEDYEINKTHLLPYGKNRLFLEDWVEDNFDDYLIVRLPGLYGKNLKKNFIYDYLQVIPFMLRDAKFNELFKIDDRLIKYYKKLNNGFYQCRILNSKEKENCKTIFKGLGFSALNFTDSRSEFQFYNLKYLWTHIEVALKLQITKINLVTEPISVNELYQYLTQEVFDNKILDNAPMYHFKTKYSSFFNGSNGYILSKNFVLNDIKRFIEGAK